jgi:hypothetical protein
MRSHHPPPSNWLSSKQDKWIWCSFRTLLLRLHSILSGFLTWILEPLKFIELLGFWTFYIVRYSRKQKTRRFRDWICFRPRVRGKTPTQLGPRLAFSKGPNWVGVVLLIWGRKQIQFPKRRIFYFLEYRTMGKVHKPSNSVCYTASSEPFRTNKILVTKASLNIKNL